MPIEDNGILITNAVEKANMYAQQIVFQNWQNKDVYIILIKI